MTLRRRRPTLLYVSCLAALTACASGAKNVSMDGALSAGAAGRDRDNPNIITREEIAKSKARNGWEAVRRNARHLVLVERRGPVDSDVGVQHRGPDSLFNSDDFVLVVDGVLTTEMRRLREIPAGTIELIEILSAREAVLRYGTDAGGGAIVVTTANRRGTWPVR